MKAVGNFAGQGPDKALCQGLKANGNPEFCRNELSMDIFEETALGFALNDQISVIVRPRKSLGMVPSIVLSGTYSDEDVRRFQALKKRFKRPEKEVVYQVSGTRLRLS